MDLILALGEDTSSQVVPSLPSLERVIEIRWLVWRAYGRCRDSFRKWKTDKWKNPADLLGTVRLWRSLRDGRYTQGGSV